MSNNDSNTYKITLDNNVIIDEQDRYSDEYDEVEIFNKQSDHDPLRFEQHYKRDNMVSANYTRQTDNPVIMNRSQLTQSRINGDYQRDNRECYSEMPSRYREDGRYRYEEDRSKFEDDRRFRSGQSFDTESSDSDFPQRKKGKKRSGVNANPSSEVREQLKYPHYSLGQQTGFIGLNIPFHQLIYDQFVAGELGTIVATCDRNEREGRTKLLQCISVWKLCAGITWPQVQNTYAHILRKLENKEISWLADFNRFERTIYDKVILTTQKEKQKMSKTTEDNTVWFCKSFQRPEGCSKEAPHTGWVKGQKKLLQHVCATCWQKD